MYWVETRFGHIASSVVIHDLSVLSMSSVPDKADTPLGMDANAVLSFKEGDVPFS